jgi:cytochrome P450
VNWLPADGQDIYNHRSNVQKSRVYSTLVHRAPNTLTLIDKVEHGKRRRIISQGFSDAALRTYQPKILAQIQNFCSALTTADKYEGAESMEKSTLWTKPQNMARWR